MADEQSRVNQVHLYNEEWWFWDETRETRIGPYHSDKEAAVAACLYQDIILDGKTSKRGQEWQAFQVIVRGHIEGYTVPQYGDLPNDPLWKDWDAKSCALAIKKLCERADTNQRGPEEQLRDCLKMAHWACARYYKLQGMGGK